MGEASPRIAIWPPQSIEQRAAFLGRTDTGGSIWPAFKLTDNARGERAATRLTVRVAGAWGARATDIVVASVPSCAHAGSVLAGCADAGHRQSRADVLLASAAAGIMVAALLLAILPLADAGTALNAALAEVANVDATESIEADLFLTPALASPGAGVIGSRERAKADARAKKGAHGDTAAR